MPVPDPVIPVESRMRLQGQPKAMVDSFAAALRSDLDWKDKAGADKVQIWEATAAGWHLMLFGFSIADQPGRQPGDMGYNLSMRSQEHNIVLMSDGAEWHDIAIWLNQRREEKLKDFLGSGRVPTKAEIRKLIAQRQLRQGELDLRDPDQLKLAVHWTRDLIGSLKSDPCGWGIPRDGSTFMIWRKQKRIRIIQGPLTMPTRICFYALGYAIENDTASEHDAMMCRLWASLYEP